MTNILVALDLGEASKRALAHARTLATCFKGSLHLLCVVQSPFALPWAPAAPREELMVLLGQMERDASTYLEGLLTPDEGRTYGATLTIAMTDPYWQAGGRDPRVRQGACHYAHVMGRDGHGSPIAATSIGSVAQAIAREAPCPVLLVPAA